MLVPDRVIVPVPFLFNPRLLLDPSIKVPLKTVVELSAPAVKVAEVPPLLVTLPLPASEPTLLENPLRSRMEFTVNAEFVLNAVVAPATSVPTLTVVTPV